MRWALSTALLCLAANANAWNDKWTKIPKWGKDPQKANEKRIKKEYEEGFGTAGDFPIDPKDGTKVTDYKWSTEDQRALIETNKGAVYFREYIAQEVFAAQLAEYLGLCVAKSRYIPFDSRELSEWEDIIEDVSENITPDNEERVNFLMDNQAGVQEIEFIDGAVIRGYQARYGYDAILYDIGKLFAFDIFINDPHNCRFNKKSANGKSDRIWTCSDEHEFNFVISPKRGVCGYSRAYRRLDINSDEGNKFRQFFVLAKTGETTIELAKAIAYVAGDMFEENLTLDRRSAAEIILKGALSTFKRLLEIDDKVFNEISETSGLHESYGYGLGERIRMLKIIADTPAAEEGGAFLEEKTVSSRRQTKSTLTPQ